MGLYRKARPGESATVVTRSGPVVTSVVTLKAEDIPAPPEMFEQPPPVSSKLRTADRHKGSRAAYMREYRKRAKK